MKISMGKIWYTCILMGNEMYLFRIQQALQVFFTTNKNVSHITGEFGLWLHLP